MTLDEFRASIAAGIAPTVAPLLLALWHDARGNWDEAHRIAQDVDTNDGAWVHAYLHRREGDLENARYWYRRAGRQEAVDALEQEWMRIVETLL
jgi:hypothetical protein